ncbi:MAG: hypothetical protein AAF845_01835 [Bacteroidota bacterium]
MRSDLPAYRELIATGFVGSLKRDVLIEARDDFEFLCHVRARFAEASAAAAEVASECTAMLATDLVTAGLCDLRPWPPDETWKNEPAALSFDAVVFGANRCSEADRSISDLVLTVTDEGAAWVERYRRLVSEL